MQTGKSILHWWHQHHRQRNWTYRRWSGTPRWSASRLKGAHPGRRDSERKHRDHHQVDVRYRGYIGQKKRRGNYSSFLNRFRDLGEAGIGGLGGLWGHESAAGEEGGRSNIELASVHLLLSLARPRKGSTPTLTPRTDWWAGRGKFKDGDRRGRWFPAIYRGCSWCNWFEFRWQARP